MSSHKIEMPTDITVPSDSIWAKLPMIGGVMAVAGLGATLGTAISGDGGRAIFSYLFAYEAVLALALGALAWLLIDHTVRSSWSISVRRIAETAVATLPVFIVLWIPIGTIGFHDLYPWSHETTDSLLIGKRWFLSPGFFYARAAFYFAVWAFLGNRLHALSTQQDALNDNPAARDVITRKIWKLCAGGIFAWALTQSFAAVDWLMSLQPHWYSTIFGVYFFAQSILAFFAMMALISMGLQKSGMLKNAITVEHFHDLGKFTYGFTVFWAYIAFSQFMLMWYAGIPEETEFYLARLSGGWEYVSYALPVAHFFIPFLFMLSRHIKRSRTGLAMAAIWTLVMHCVDMYWLVLPNFGAHSETGHHAPHLPLSWLDFAALIGMAGAFIAAFSSVLKKHKVICINDARLPESLAHENF
jgi:hypothetical protein